MIGTLAGLMLSMLLAALDQTIVGTAEPMIIASLSGFDRYPWVSTAYLLCSTISVPIFAENDAPSTPTSGVFWGLGANDWTSVFATDGDGDSLTYTITKQPQHGSASYNQGLQTLNTTGAQNNDTITLTVTDGYYVVNNGVVTGTPASSSRTYTV